VLLLAVSLMRIANGRHLAEGTLANEFKHMVIIKSHCAVRRRCLSCYVSSNVLSYM
jgi:hypothetical protein